MDFEDWLAVRYDMDALSRNKDVEGHALSDINNKRHVRILDIGAGTAANFRYLSDKIMCNEQEWTLVDQNKDLLRVAKEEITRKLGAPVLDSTDRSVFETSGKKIKVRFVVDDIFSPSSSLLDSSCDLVVANAFFDLGAENQLATFFQVLGTASCAFLATINYSGMGFTPSEEDDKYWIHQYHNHMARQQPFGISLGPECVAHMSVLSKNMDVKMGSSDWEMSGGHAVAIGIFDFMEAALQDLGLDMEKFNRWRDSKLGGKVKVNHVDFACKSAN